MPILAIKLSNGRDLHFQFTEEQTQAPEVVGIALLMAEIEHMRQTWTPHRAPLAESALVALHRQVTSGNGVGSSIVTYPTFRRIVRSTEAAHGVGNVAERVQ